jgi:hypothetical protein
MTNNTSSRRELPASLTIATPPQDRRLKRPRSSFFPERSLRLWANRPYLSPGQPESSIPSDGKPSDPSRTSWQAWSKGATRSMARPQTQYSVNAHNYTVAELPATESNSRRRGRCQSSFVVSPLSRSLDSVATPVSRNESSTIGSRISSLILRRNSHSLGDTADAQSGLISTSELGGQYSGGHRAFPGPRITRTSPRSTSPISQPSISHPQALQVSNRGRPSHNSYSPVGSNPFQPWARPRPASAMGPTTSSTMETSSFVPQLQQRGFSYSSAPSRPSNNAVHLDTNMRLEAEPEPFVSPLDFALFAEATSSLGFDLSSSAAAPSIFQPPPFTQTQSFPLPQSLQTPRPPSTSSHLQPLQQSGSQRSHSAPPRPSPYNQHARSTSDNSQTPAYSTEEPTRAQLLLVALGLDDDGMRPNDDELPDYETSQREANAAKQYEATRRARELEQGWLRGRAERVGRRRRS